MEGVQNRTEANHPEPMPANQISETERMCEDVTIEEAMESKIYQCQRGTAEDACSSFKTQITTIDDIIIESSDPENDDNEEDFRMLSAFQIPSTRRSTGLPRIDSNFEVNIDDEIIPYNTDDFLNGWRTEAIFPGEFQNHTGSGESELAELIEDAPFASRLPLHRLPRVFSSQPFDSHPQLPPPAEMDCWLPASLPPRSIIRQQAYRQLRDYPVVVMSDIECCSFESFTSKSKTSDSCCSIGCSSSSIHLSGRSWSSILGSIPTDQEGSATVLSSDIPSALCSASQRNDDALLKEHDYSMIDVQQIVEVETAPFFSSPACSMSTDSLEATPREADPRRSPYRECRTAEQFVTAIRNALCLPKIPQCRTQTKEDNDKMIMATPDARHLKIKCSHALTTWREIAQAKATQDNGKDQQAQSYPPLEIEELKYSSTTMSEDIFEDKVTYIAWKPNSSPLHEAMSPSPRNQSHVERECSSSNFLSPGIWTEGWENVMKIIMDEGFGPTTDCLNPCQTEVPPTLLNSDLLDCSAEGNIGVDLEEEILQRFPNCSRENLVRYHSNTGDNVQNSNDQSEIFSQGSCIDKNVTDPSLQQNAAPQDDDETSLQVVLEDKLACSGQTNSTLATDSDDIFSSSHPRTAVAKTECHISLTDQDPPQNEEIKNDTLIPSGTEPPPASQCAKPYEPDEKLWFSSPSNSRQNFRSYENTPDSHHVVNHNTYPPVHRTTDGGENTPERGDDDVEKTPGNQSSRQLSGDTVGSSSTSSAVKSADALETRQDDGDGTSPDIFEGEKSQPDRDSALAVSSEPNEENAQHPSDPVGESSQSHQDTGEQLHKTLRKRQPLDDPTTAAPHSPDPFSFSSSSSGSPSRNLDALYLTQPSASKNQLQVRNKRRRLKELDRSSGKRARTSWYQWCQNAKNMLTLGKQSRDEALTKATERRTSSNSEHLEQEKEDEHTLSSDSQESHTASESDQEVPSRSTHDCDNQRCSPTGCQGAVVCERRPLFRWMEPSLRLAEQSILGEEHHGAQEHRFPARRPSIRLGLSKRARPPPLHKRFQWWVSQLFRSAMLSAVSVFRTQNRT